MSQPTIQNGSKGASVKLCQERLNAKGFHITADGVFGNATELAVEQFQASHNLKVDGQVGPATWGYLMSAGSVPTPEEVLAEAKASLLSKIPTSTPMSVQEVLKVAIGKLGAKEKPSGSNGGSEIAEIVGGDGKAPSAYFQYWKISDKTTMPPWCCLFVCWALKKGLQKTTWKEIPFGDWFGGCPQVETWAKKNGKWLSPLPAMIPSGAAFTISRSLSGSDPASSTGAGHIGFIVADNGDGTVTTIEGNVSNAVGSHKRKKSDLRGVVLWW